MAFSRLSLARRLKSRHSSTKARKARDNRRRQRLQVEQLELRTLLTVGGPVILGGDDLTDHGSIDTPVIVDVPGTGNVVNEIEANNNSASANGVSLGDDFSAAIGASGDVDYLSFAGTVGQTIQATTVLDTLPGSTLTLFNTDGTTQLASGGLASQIEFTLPSTGTFFLRAAATGGTPGPGSGNSVGETEVNDTAASADLIAIGDDYSGSIASAGESDYVSFDAVADQTIFATTVLGSLGDSTLTLYDTDGTTELDFDDDGGIGLASQISFVAPATGTYFLAVEGFGSSTGTYTLELRPAATVTGTYSIELRERVLSFPTPGPATGTTVADTEVNNTTLAANAMNVGDDFQGDLPDAADVDYVKFAASVGQVIQARTVLDTLSDSTLELYDTDGVTLLDFDDDGGGGLASLIQFTVPATGTYFFEVDGLSGDTGTYLLELREITLSPTPSIANFHEGWRYIVRALENIAPAVNRPGNDGSIAVLGSTDSTQTAANAGGAYHFAVPMAAATTPSLSGVATFYDGAAAINQFFADLAAGVVNPAIIVTAGAGSTNDLDSAEGTALTDNAFGIANFVNSGGGLLSHGDQPDVSYGWLSSLLPGTLAPALLDETGLELTADGIAAFSGITNADINAGPFHNYFEPQSAFNSFLNVLAIKPDLLDIDGNPIAVIIGGVVTIPGSISLAPLTGSHLVGLTHTVTATVLDGNPPAPAASVAVTFTVVAGPNAGVTGVVQTDSNGQASFTYTGSGGPGTDEIQAQFVDSKGDTQLSNAVDGIWLAVPEVHGFKWNDLDGDSVWDAGEPGLDGWTVELLLDGQVVDTATTGDDPNTPDVEVGAYGFTNLSAGTYIVREVLQVGWQRTFPGDGGEHQFVLVDGQIISGAFGTAESPNFGNQLIPLPDPAEIHGFKWNDLDGDGTWDTGEPGLDGWTIELVQDGQVIGSTVTGDDPNTPDVEAGAYGFTGLAAGTYTVREVLQAGWQQNYPAGPGEHVLTLEAGQIVNADSGEAHEEVLAHFQNDPDPAHPDFGLVLGGNKLYGTTTTLVFSINTDGTGLTTLKQLGGGMSPRAKLALDGTTLYGTTMNGGSQSVGTIFSMQTDGTNFQVIHNFAGGFDDGERPFSGVIVSGGKLYGVTREGGNDDLGVVYSMNTDGTGFTLLHEFAGFFGTDGAEPRCELLLIGSTLYGTTQHGGTQNSGTVFKINTDGTGYATLHDFVEPSGVIPTSGLVNSGANLYGTTSAGGAGADVGGTIYTLDTSGAGYDTLHEFTPAAAQGIQPNSALTLDGSTLYGTTARGASGGTVFSIGTDGSNFDVLHFFGSTGTDGLFPQFAGVVQDGSKLYGTTFQGGMNQNGVLYSIQLPVVVPNFGNQLIPVPLSEIHGFKWNDLDGDSAWDGGEPGLDGWTIELVQDGQVIGTTITGDDPATQEVEVGAYGFTGLVAGSYTVREVLQSGWQQTFPGGSEYTIDLGVVSVATVKNIATGIVDASGDKIAHLGEDTDFVIGAGSADEVGTVPVAVQAPLPPPYMGDDASTNSRWIAINSAVGEQGIDVPAGDYFWELHVDLTGFDASTAQLTGLRYAADNKMELLTINDQVAYTRPVSFGSDFNPFTDVGTVGLGMFQPGDNVLKFRVLNDGTAVTALALRLEGLVEAETAAAEIVAGRFGVAETPNFGNQLIPLPDPAEIHGFKWNDLDGDGTWDTGEPGLDGWTIELVQDGQVIGSTVTGDDPNTPDVEVGAYGFTDLEAGNYTVREVLQNGWQQTFPGGNGQHDLALVSGQIVAGASGTAETPNFGNQVIPPPPPAEIHGFKWNDIDGDGTWDTGEPGLDGWTIELVQDGQVIGSTVTGDDPSTPDVEVGAYGFADLEAGNYTVREVLQNGWQQTFPGGNGQHDLALVSGQIVAGASGTAETPNFGNQVIPPPPPAEIHGFKWNDIDGDGTWDTGEPGLDGWTIELVQDGQVIDSTVTGDDPNTPDVEAGAYWFTQLGAGSYTVREVLQSGWQQTYPGGSGQHSLNLAASQIVFGRLGSAEAPNFGNQLIPPTQPKGNNGVGNGIDPPPPGNPPTNDGPGTSPGNPGNKGGANGNGNGNGNGNAQGNNGVGNGVDSQPPGNPPVNDGAGTSPGSPGQTGNSKSAKKGAAATGISLTLGESLLALDQVMAQLGRS